MNKNKETIIRKLNELLASYEIHYQNLRALHWNIKGQHFFELHEKYEELYGNAQEIIDILAERILTYKTTPLYKFSDYMKASVITENEYISEGTKGVKYIVDAQNALLKLEREIFVLSDTDDDEGTSALVSDLIREKEKSIWMFSAWLSK